MAVRSLSWSIARRSRNFSMAVLATCAMLLPSCTHAAHPSSDNPGCDPAKMQAMVNRGYELLNADNGIKRTWQPTR